MPAGRAAAASRKRRVSRVIQRRPWLAAAAIAVIRRTRARFTAGVVGVVLNPAGQILLVEHVFHAQTPWGLPGGWLERGESPDEGLRRELREELGLTVTVEEPLLVRSGLRGTHIDMAFLCHTRGSVQHLCNELLDYRWTTCSDLPPLAPFHRAVVEAACARRLEKKDEMV
jgi:ADP-ribose pyrophosphatase YjhB (NUDIX family)